MPGLQLCLMQMHSHKHLLTHEQRMLINQLLLQKQELVHPEFPDAVKGLDGMIVADKFLKEKECTGVLIGGLSEAVWHKNRTEKELSSHKDVDVLITDEYFRPKPIEKGVDWWVYERGALTIHRPCGDIELEKKWLENYYSIVLGFMVNQKKKLNSGLYIPSPWFVAKMREIESVSNIDYRVYQGDVEEIGDALFKKFRGKLGARLPKFVTERFKGQILCDFYEKMPCFLFLYTPRKYFSCFTFKNSRL